MNNIFDKSNQLDLMERTQASTAETYAPKYTSEAKPVSNITYTQTMSSKHRGMLSVEPLYKRSRNKEFAKNYEPDDEYLQDYFECMQELYADLVDDCITELKRWCVEVRALKRRYPKYEDYESKRIEICSLLSEQDSAFPFDQYFEKGADDTADAGAYLFYLALDDSRISGEEYATMLLSGIQWLIQKRDSLAAETSINPEMKNNSTYQPVTQGVAEEDEESAELKKLIIEDLKLTMPTTHRGEILFAIKDAYQLRDKPWAKSNAKFAERIAPIIGGTASAISREIAREAEELKILNTHKYISLSNLTTDFLVKNCKCSVVAAERRFKKWSEHLRLIQTYLSQDKDETINKTSKTNETNETNNG